MALTDIAIRALKPREIRYYAKDERGLWLEVFPQGGMAWRYRYSLNGKPEKVAIGKYPTGTTYFATVIAGTTHRYEAVCAQS
jgi:hypothetical protein